MEYVFVNYCKGVESCKYHAPVFLPWLPYHITQIDLKVRWVVSLAYLEAHGTSKPLRIGLITRLVIGVIYRRPVTEITGRAISAVISSYKVP